MSIIYQCDRCGNSVVQFKDLFSLEFSRNGTNDKVLITNKDLCEDCVDDVRSFLDSKPKKTTKHELKGVTEESLS